MILVPLSVLLYLKMDNFVWLLIVPIILINEVLIIRKDIKKIKRVTTTA